jgi:hypothetical protein
VKGVPLSVIEDGVFRAMSWIVIKFEGVVRETSD